MRCIALALLLTACGCSLLPPLETTLPVPEPTPTPCPTPTPAPKPTKVVFNAPDVVGVGTPFAVLLCEPFRPGVVLSIDSFVLGTFGHHAQTDCMIVTVPGLNTPGTRLLKTDGHQREIVVFGK